METDQDEVQDVSTNIGLTAPDPFDFHLYIAHAVQDSTIVRQLTDLLEKECKLIIRLRTHDDSSQTADGDNYSIFNNVEFSEKCLVYLTPNYLTDCRADQETKAISDKADCFGKDHAIVLKDPSVGSVPVLLRELPTFHWSLSDGITSLPDGFKAMLLKRPDMKLIPQLPHKISGYFEAFVYYYDYLNFILDGYGTRMSMKMASVAREAGRTINYVRQLVIVVPDSCFAPPDIEDKQKIFQVEQTFVECCGHRGGCKFRDYKTPVFRLEPDSRTNDAIYFAAEFPACLLTMYEIQLGGLAGLTVDDLYRERESFCETLTGILSHPDNVDKCRESYMLLRWSDKGEVGLADFLLSSLRDSVLETDGRHSEREVPSDRTSQNAPNEQIDFIRVSGDCEPVFHEQQNYRMTNRPRGICLIVNLCTPDATTSVDVLRKLFAETLSFRVDVVGGGPSCSEELEKLMAETSREDHSRFDVFACCIIACGRPGIVWTGDGKKLEVLKLTEYFSDKNCPALSEKPKLFLIMTSHRDDDVGGSDTSSTPATRSSSLDVTTPVPANPAVPRSLSHDDHRRRRGRLILLDAMSSSESVDDGELIVPPYPDFIVSYADLRHCTDIERYVTILSDQLGAAVDVEKALNNAAQKFAVDETSSSDVGKFMLTCITHKRLVFN